MNGLSEARVCRSASQGIVSEAIQVVIASGIHLFPFRTEKLSLIAPMVLRHKWESRSPPFFLKTGEVHPPQGAGTSPVFFVLRWEAGKDPD